MPCCSSLCRLAASSSCWATRGIHEKVGQEFWHRIVRTVTEKLKQGDYTGGLVAGIEAVGEDLAKHFPYDATGDTNELPDDVDFGPGS